jgi:hypothetical protein
MKNCGGTHCIGGWVDPRICLDIMDKRKISYPCRESNPGRRSIGWAVPAQTHIVITTDEEILIIPFFFRIIRRYSRFISITTALRNHFIFLPQNSQNIKTSVSNVKTTGQPDQRSPTGIVSKSQDQPDLYCKPRSWRSGPIVRKS